MEALIHVAKTKLRLEQKKQMKTILLVILAMGRNCILEAPEPEPAEVIFLGITILFFKKHFSENFKNFKKKEYLPKLLESTLFLELNSSILFL